MKMLSTLARLGAVLLFVMQANLPVHAFNPVVTVHIHGPGCRPDCTSGNNNPTPAPNGAPIDGGASLLLAAGAAYAVRRIRKSNKQVSEA